MRRVLALFLISAAAVVAAPAIAGGGVEGDGLDVELVSPIEPLTFTATFESGTCEQGDFDADVEANDEPVTPISATQSDTDSDVFTFVLPPGTPAGVLSVDITCDNGDGNSRESGVREWASLAVTKTVVGPAPSSATFTVHVACESTLPDASATDLPDDFAADLHYTAVGGIHYVYGDHAIKCTLSETNTGGATSTTIVPEVVREDSGGPYSATVTNTFAAAIQPTFTG